MLASQPNYGRLAYVATAVTDEYQKITGSNSSFGRENNQLVALMTPYANRFRFDHRDVQCQKGMAPPYTADEYAALWAPSKLNTVRRQLYGVIVNAGLSAPSYVANSLEYRLEGCGAAIVDSDQLDTCVNSLTR